MVAVAWFVVEPCSNLAWISSTDDGSQVWYEREGETLLRQCCTYPTPLVITIKQGGILHIYPGLLTAVQR